MWFPIEGGSSSGPLMFGRARRTPFCARACRTFLRRSKCLCPANRASNELDLAHHRFELSKGHSGDELCLERFYLKWFFGFWPVRLDPFSKQVIDQVLFF